MTEQILLALDRPAADAMVELLLDHLTHLPRQRSASLYREECGVLWLATCLAADETTASTVEASAVLIEGLRGLLSPADFAIATASRRLNWPSSLAWPSHPSPAGKLAEWCQSEGIEICSVASHAGTPAAE